MYVIGIGSDWWLARKRAEQGKADLSASQVEDSIFYCALGVMLGGRLGYTLFYNVPAFVGQPLN